ncbi:BLUF domain-containing protein [uncultured Thioclava sp.]|mgnify:CR=1 FL=1|uniref:BLUF domain-containing protein n=1 Tax=Thioclava arctica TaxID=3238301 RepID=A0ABV3TGI2_9RHOB|nr:BLUF domain-containing protein [uncultured Thioclava sp.]
MGFVHFLYRSIPAFADFDDSDRDILRSALLNNAAHGITGYLWRTGDQFVQALHGPADAMDVLYRRLTEDPRHSDLDLLLRAPAPAESPFESWSMGYDHFIDSELGLERDLDGARPTLTPDRVQMVWDGLVRAAHSAMQFGSIQPMARAPLESEVEYLARISAAQ